MKIQEILLK